MAVATRLPDPLMSPNKTLAPRFALLAAFLACVAVLPAQAHDNASGPSAATGSFVGTDLVSGTVQSLIVEDRVRGRTTAYSLLRQDDGTIVPLAGTLAGTLKAGARVAILGRRDGPQFEVAQVEPLGGDIAAVGGSVQVQGTLAVIHSDDFATGTSQFLYHVRDAAGKLTNLKVGALPAPLRGGMQVVVSGQQDSDPSSLVPQSIVILSDSTLSQPLAATVNQVLVIMANYNNTTAPAFTQAQGQAVMITNANSVSNYYNEVSYGQQTLNVTVTPWLTMTTMAQPATCDWPTIGTQAEAAATAAGYNLANYGFIVHLFPGLGSCGWSGLAYVGFPHSSFINGIGSFQTLVVAHEMGHNFGLLHAGSLNCGAASIGGSCSVAEYGDPWDTMGNQRAMHFNAAQKNILGWIPSSSVKTHTSGTASYTLNVLENGGGSVYAVTIPTSNPNRTYWLEFRQPVGFDAALSSYPNNGAQIRVSYPFEWASGSDDTEIVDMTPATPGTFTDSALVAGQTYSDATVGLSVTVTSASSSALTVNVTTSGGQSTTTTETSSLNPSTAGASVTLTATVTGTAPTGTVNFLDNGGSIAGCSAKALAGSGNTRSATCVSSTLAGGNHSMVATYSGNSSNAASSSTAFSQVVNKVASATALGSSSNPSSTGTPVTFTATVTGVNPTGTVNFKDGASSISSCSAAGFTGGSGNVRTAQCTTSTLSIATHSITAVYAGDATNNGSTSSALSQVVNNAAPPSINVALASNGGVATASSTMSASFPASAINNGDEAGLNFGAGGVWEDATPSAFPDWVEIDFNGSKNIDHVVVFTVQNNSSTPAQPTDTMTFTTGKNSKGVTAFNVQTWNGSAWVTQGSVSGNNLVKRTVAFAATTTTKIRVVINATANGKNSYLTEVEAWTVGTTPPPPSGTTLASSLDPAKPAQGVTFTATVTGTNPTGTVAFKNGAGAIAGCASVALTGSGNSRTASCATSFASTGTYNIVGSYSGNGSNPASSSAALPQVVKAAK